VPVLRRAGARYAGCGTKARCAEGTLCRVRYEGALCWKLALGSVIVCWAWFQIAARCARRDPVRSVIPTKRPSWSAWFRAGVVGAYRWRASDGDRDAEHAVAADRFARKIVGFLKASPGALAAAERRPVRRHQVALLYQLYYTYETKRSA